MIKDKRSVADVINDAKNNDAEVKVREMAPVVIGSIIAIDENSSVARELKGKEPRLYSALLNSFLITLSANLAVLGRSPAEAVDYMASIDAGGGKKGVAVMISEDDGRKA